MDNREDKKNEACATRQQGDMLSHLEWAERTVQSWPEWKRNMLGSELSEQDESGHNHTSSEQTMKC